jgi:release factor glutamine methyltransferase
MTLGQALKRGQSLLQPSASAQLDAELLLAKIFNLSRSNLLARLDKKISWLQQLRFHWLIKQRQTGKPIAYLIGRKEFYGRDFFINRQVLIPRPDTEIIIERALEITRANPTINTILDIGTGSGCIAITLACGLPNIKVLAIDISRPAIRLAQKNAGWHKVGNQITWLLGDLLQPILRLNGPNLHNHLLIANLPYLLPAEVKDELRFEPYQALVSGQDGLGHYRRLIKQISSLANPRRPQRILLEIHPPTLNDLIKIINLDLSPQKLTTLPDLAGRPRVLDIELN